MNRPINENVQNALGKMGVNYPKKAEVTYGTEIVIEGADEPEVEHLLATAERTGKLSGVEKGEDRVRFLFEDSFFANRFLDFAKVRSRTQEGMRVRKSIHPRPITKK